MFVPAFYQYVRETQHEAYATVQSPCLKGKKFIAVQHSPDVEKSQGYHLAIFYGKMEYTDKTSLIPLKENKIQLQCIYFIVL
jgi:hypothetical protein